LRAIQEGEVEPVGARKPVKVDARIISATNRDLAADVAAGRFREDLFYRLHVFPIAVPALAERPEDIAELVRHFLARFAAEEGKRIRSISAEALALLSAYRWPGNVRQLENAVFRAVVLAETDEVGSGEFPQIATQLSRRPGGSAGDDALPKPVPPPAFEPAVPIEEHHPAGMGGSIAPYGLPAASLPLMDESGEVRPLEELETEVIRFAVAHYRGQMSEVARRLRIGRSTLYRKLDLLGFEADAAEADNQSSVKAL
jgi:DNA-binding NtrC family response regulator